MIPIARRGLAAIAAGLAVPSLAAPSLVRAQSAAPDPQHVLQLDVRDGRVVIQMLPELAPRHVERITLLTRRGFYNNTPFHRVIPGFMAQGGDPTGTGTGGARNIGLPDLPAEFTPASRARFIRGVCGMARTSDPNTANSQFFIMFGPSPGLDGQYTIWGRVLSGMEVVDRIKPGEGQSGMVRDPDRIRRMSIAADG